MLFILLAIFWSVLLALNTRMCIKERMFGWLIFIDSMLVIILFVTIINFLDFIVKI